MTKPDIVWITLDSIRADHTTLDGYERDTTPQLASIADDGVGFSQCISHGMSTRTSTASILTGTYPSHHQTWSYTKQTEVDALPDELRTVPELLSEAGYHTVGISRNSHFSRATELDRGFDEFDLVYANDPTTIVSRLLRTVGTRTLAKYALNVRRHSAGFTTDLHKHSTAFFVNELLERKLRRAAADDMPHFIYAHYQEPHSLYHPPLPYIDKYMEEIELDREEAVKVAERMHKDVLPAGTPEFTDDEWAGLEALYDAEIAYTDEMVGRVHALSRRLGMNDAIFVITADHGDLFGEYGLVGHMHCLHDGLIRVPLVTQGIDGIAKKSDELVQHMDVMETILNTVGADTEQFQGIDLRTETREYTISQRAPTEQAPEHLHREMLTALRDTEFKLLHSEYGTELFKLPDEEMDKSDEYPERAAALREAAETFFETDGTPIITEKKKVIDDELEEHLRDMGYAV